MKVILFALMSFSAMADSCESFFDQRGEGLEKTQKAQLCYQTSLNEATDELFKSQLLVKLSYLKFFQAENYSIKKEALLFDAMEIAEKAVLIFGAKYSLGEYRSLPSASQVVLAEALYNYGLIVARYVDEKGVVEALKRMDDIKKSMTTIIRLKQEEVAHHGAHRVLGIFHTKVPAIAGGDLKLAKTYLEAAIQGSLYRGNLSRYPLNHIVYADYLFKIGNNTESCAELQKVIQLSPEDIRSLENGLNFETIKNVKEARNTFKERKCSR
jgi:tetratricopeptide (TPR) repeat protein